MGNTSNGIFNLFKFNQRLTKLGHHCDITRMRRKECVVRNIYIYDGKTKWRRAGDVYRTPTKAQDFLITRFSQIEREH